MNIEIVTRLDDVTRAGVARVMDVLLPGEGALPAATEVGAQGNWLDRVLLADPTLEPLVRSVGTHANGSKPVNYEVIAQWMGDDLERLVFALHAAYYMVDTVREKLNYPGQMRLPVALATPEQICSDELIAPVEARGKIFVATPEQ